MITLSIAESNVIQSLGEFLQSVLPTGFEVMRGQVNRVAEPATADYAVMWPVLRERIETNIDTYDSTAQTKSMMQPMKISIQVDVHGPSSADNAQIISTVFRDGLGVDTFKSSGFDVEPLYSDDPRQAPFVNGEQQVEERWILTMAMQANPIVGTSQQSATTVTLNPIIAADVIYAAQ